MGNGVSSTDSVHGFYMTKFEGLSDKDKEKYTQNYQALLAANHGAEEALEILDQQFKQEEAERLKKEELEGGEEESKEKNSTNEAAGEIGQKVEIELTNLQEAIATAVSHGKTPLIVDRSADHKVDTFMGYGNAIQLDGKKMGLDKSMKKIPVPDIMEEARKKLVTALKNGQTFAITLSASVTDFAKTFNDESASQNHGLDLEGKAYFPLQLFTKAGKDVITSESLLDALYTEEDKEHTAGLAIAKEGFQTIITSHFASDSFEEYLFGNDWGLPKPIENYQFIVIKYGDDVELIN